MSGSKHIDKLSWAVTAFILIVTILFMNSDALGLEAMAHTMGYENRLFDNTKVHTIDIVMNDWDEFIENATSEEYYTAAVVIDGEAYKNVGIRGKGNTSLSTVSSMNSSRYSFKVEFDHYDSSITYHGLDKLSLNNLIQDSTMMKDYLTYTMMKEFGAAAPLCSFVYITVNGEEWGLYLAVEGIEDSFLERNYGSNYGNLYKPDSMSFGGGRGNGKNFNMNDFMNKEESSGESDQSNQSTTIPQRPNLGNFDPSQIPNLGDFDPSQRPNLGDFDPSQIPNQGNFDPSQIPNLGDFDSSQIPNQGNFDPSQRPNQGNFDSSQIPNQGNFDPSQIPDQGNIDSSQIPDQGNIDSSQMPEGFSGSKPDRGNFDFSQIPGSTQEESGFKDKDKSAFGGDRGGFGGMGSSDVKLQYVDDNVDSYSNIWNNAKTDITAADQTRLIESLKKLSEEEQIDSVVQIEQVIRYFVVHNYVSNGDSYTGSMIHNYYLYEENGQMAMIPWDYNLAFGTFQGGNAQSTVNTPIDAPVSGGSGEDRPMWNWILSDETYTELYHQYFAEFLNTVDTASIIDNAYNLIKSFVEKDPTAFYTYEEFETGVETLRQFCTMRSESISMQLANGETTSNMNYVDASTLTLSDMGSMGMGGGFGGGMGGGFGGRDFPSQSSEGAETTLSENSDSTESSGNGNRPSRDSMQMPGGDFNFNINGMGNTAQSSTNWIWLVVSILILGAGLILAKRLKH